MLMVVLFPLSCCVTSIVFSNKEEEGDQRRRLRHDGPSVVIVEAPAESLGKLHRIEAVQASIELDDGRTVPMTAASTTSRDWGDVITIEKLTSYGIAIGDGQSKADMRFELAFDGSTEPYAGLDGTRILSGVARLPYIVESEQSVFDERLSEFRHTEQVRVGGPGVGPTGQELADQRLGMFVIFGSVATVLLVGLNLVLPRPKGDTRTEHDLIEAAMSGQRR